MKFNIIAIAIIILLLSLIYAIAVTPTDSKAEAQFDKKYCEAVAIWLAQKDRGLEPKERNGHSDYKKIAADVCPGLKPAY